MSLSPAKSHQKLSSRESYRFALKSPAITTSFSRVENGFPLNAASNAFSSAFISASWSWFFP